MQELVKGTIEELPVEIHDRLGQLESLDGVTTSFQITDEPGTNIIVPWTICNSTAMIALPLVNTSTMNYAIYKLYVKVAVSPEFPILGPFEFAVV